MDGSFSLKSALERFLARCPKLLSFPQFDALAKKVFVLFVWFLIKFERLLQNFAFVLFGF
jgi:hypothetical protein